MRGLVRGATIATSPTSSFLHGAYSDAVGSGSAAGQVFRSTRNPWTAFDRQRDVVLLPSGTRAMYKVLLEVHRRSRAGAARHQYCAYPSLESIIVASGGSMSSPTRAISIMPSRITSASCAIISAQAWRSSPTGHPLMVAGLDAVVAVDGNGEWIDVA
jgi:hypothetical protein